MDGVGEAGAVLRASIGVGVLGPGKVDPGHDRHGEQLRTDGVHLRVVPVALVFHHPAVVVESLTFFSWPRPGAGMS